jgi:hypothetical protein
MKITKQQLREIIKEEFLNEEHEWDSPPEGTVPGMAQDAPIEGMIEPEGPPGEHLSLIHADLAKLLDITPEAKERIKKAAQEDRRVAALVREKLYKLWELMKG